MLEGLSISDIRGTYELGMVSCLDTKDIHGNTVQTLDMGKMDYSKFTPAEMARMAFLIGLLMMTSSCRRTGSRTSRRWRASPWSRP